MLGAQVQIRDGGHQNSPLPEEFHNFHGLSTIVSMFLLYGYGSIPIHTNFRGMNIHLPAILMFTRGIEFWPIPISSHLGMCQSCVPLKSHGFFLFYYGPSPCRAGSHYAISSRISSRSYPSMIGDTTSIWVPKCAMVRMWNGHGMVMWYGPYGHPSWSGNLKVMGIQIPTFIMDWWPSSNTDAAYRCI